MLCRQTIIRKQASQNIPSMAEKRSTPPLFGGAYLENDISHGGCGRAYIMQAPCLKSPKSFLDSPGCSACQKNVDIHVRNNVEYVAML